MVIGTMTSCISIHAPTRGATNVCVARFNGNLYFNPRSYKRSDKKDKKSNYLVHNFNPRSYKRSDDARHSILYGCLENFNPRSYKRSDDMAHYFQFLVVIFQSTLLQEVRRCQTFNSIWMPGKFQSTLLQVERRYGSLLSFPCCDISIHAPTRGATSRQAILFFRLHYFNPRSYKRSDIVMENCRRYYL